MLRPLNVPPRFPKGRYFSSSSCADELQDGPGFDGAALGEAQLGAAAAADELVSGEASGIAVPAAGAEPTAGSPHDSPSVPEGEQGMVEI